jgi:deazaflavin-dependent oxidoreductase (nitroreductase family)
MGMPAIELVTTGRRTGLSRSTMLTVPVVRCDQWVLVASKGGDDRDPEWFLNLVANPEVTVNRKNEQLKMRARIANESESKELWPQVVASYKPYASYQRRSKRSIPLVICEPR